MPEFPSVRFSGDQDGLFSTEEVRNLMRAECDRATRYKYPVTAMSIAVDRLDQLGDLYGFESRDAILSEVTTVIRRNTRESDFLGYKQGGTFHALFPHTARPAGPALAGRLLRDTAALLFDEGQARVQVTLSVGVTFFAEEEAVDFDMLMGQTAVAIERASARGGNCFDVYVPPKPVLESLPLQTLDTDDLGELLASMLDEKLERFYRSAGESLPDFGGREQEVLALAVKKMEAEHQLMRDQHAVQVEKLERRLSKMSGSLEATEGALRRSLVDGVPDSGIASIYRTVQGLTDVENDAELRKEMMSKIFEANIELRSQFTTPSSGD